MHVNEVKQLREAAAEREAYERLGGVGAAVAYEVYLRAFPSDTHVDEPDAIWENATEREVYEYVKAVGMPVLFQAICGYTWTEHTPTRRTECCTSCQIQKTHLNHSQVRRLQPLWSSISTRFRRESTSTTEKNIGWRRWIGTHMSGKGVGERTNVCCTYSGVAR